MQIHKQHPVQVLWLPNTNSVIHKYFVQTNSRTRLIFLDKILLNRIHQVEVMGKMKSRKHLETTFVDNKLKGTFLIEYLNIFNQTT